jgi:hypothetical protein
MQRPWALDIVRPGEHVLGLVGIFLFQAVQSEPGKHRRSAR